MATDKPFLQSFETRECAPMQVLDLVKSLLHTGMPSWICNVVMRSKHVKRKEEGLSEIAKN